MKNESWPKPDLIEDDLKLEDEDEEAEKTQGERTKKQVEEDEREKMLRDDMEWMSSPQRLLISKKQLIKLMSSGEVVLSKMDLHGRELKPGEVVILEDEDDQGIQAEFVSSEKFQNSERVTIRLPRNEGK